MQQAFGKSRNVLADLRQAFGSSGNVPADVQQTFEKLRNLVAVVREDNSNISFLENEVQLVPNPVADFLTITTKNTSIVSLSVVDVSGRSIKKYDQVFTSIDVSSLKQGMYFVNIQLSNNQSIVKEFIKE